MRHKTFEAHNCAKEVKDTTSLRALKISQLRGDLETKRKLRLFSRKDFEYKEPACTSIEESKEPESLDTADVLSPIDAPVKVEQKRCGMC